MAQININFPGSSNPDINQTVLLDRETPVQVIIAVVRAGTKPRKGNIWKMTKALGGTIDHFETLQTNGIIDNETVSLVEV